MTFRTIRLGVLINFILLNVALLSVQLVKCQPIKEKYISAFLYSKWSETPLLLETSEFIFRNNPAGFWSFANDVTLNSNEFKSHESSNNKSYVDEVLAKASKYVSSMQFDLLKLSLSIRTYSPAIEMSRKLAEEALTTANIAGKCVTFVDVNGQVTCDVDQVEKLMEEADLSKKPFVYQFDKFYDFSDQSKEQRSRDKLIVVLYTQIGTYEFEKFHNKIVELARKESAKYAIDYLLRHNYVSVVTVDQSDAGKKIALSGYGVELDIKSTEYKAKDDSTVNAQADELNKREQKKEGEEEPPLQGFMFDRLKEQNPELKEQLDEYRKHLVESTLELAPLKAWQMQDLSLQAAQQIIDSDPDEALSLLEDFSQNFPIRARSLSKVKVRSELRKTFKSQKQILESKFSLEVGSGALYLNGLELNIETTDIFQLASSLRKEANLLESLNGIGLSLEQIRDVIYLDTSSKNTDYGVDIRDSSVQWLNDLESDKKYAYWSKSVNDILRPTYPGMMRSIGKNFYNLLFVVDPAKDESKTLLKTAESFYVNDIPVRIGFVFITNHNEQADGFVDASVAMFRAHNYIKAKSNSPAKALSFITDVYAKTSRSNELTADLIVKEFKKRYPKEKNLDDVFGIDSDYDEGRRLSMEYYKKIGLKSLHQVFVNGFPLTENEMEADVFEESIITKIMQQTNEIQMAVYKRMLDDSQNMLDWLMKKDVIMPRLNPRILSPERQYISLHGLNSKSEDFLNSIKYISSEREPSHPLTLWIVCDPDTEKGRQLIYDSINFYESSKVATRVAFLLQDSNKNDDDLMKKTMTFVLENFKPNSAYLLIKRLFKEKTFNDLKANKVTLSQLNFKDVLVDVDLEKGVNEFDLNSVLEEHELFLKTNTPFRDSSNFGIIANGWVLGPFDDDETFIDSDFSLLENFILKIGLKQIQELITQWNVANFGDKIDDKILMIHSTVSKHSSNDKRIKSPEFTSGFVNVKPKRPDSPFYDIVVIVDPLTRHSQKISTILKALTQVTNVNLIIYFNCKEKLSAPPLKSFYRYVLESELKFSQNQLVKPFAYFHNMPQSPILTMNIHSPESWMVEAVRSPFDLDNICLKEIDGDGVYGQFELEHLIIEGHAYDILSGQSPRGLQFNSGTIANPVMYDTIVMANLGYFQLKASPGMWFLKLREGRSKDIYEIVSHENTDSESKRTTNIVVVIDSFEAKVIRVKVSKKADKINENLLDDKDTEKESGSLWDSLASSLSGSGSSSGGEESVEKKENILNIFSVASGHLYERLMRIMMLTVLKNTKAKVKFWFLKNYLSPQFTQFLPYYAKEYNFDYELVQYKWPRWLHHESEKQRIIWGYKILFLDVLFPLNVEKIIYVDADQIVRADLAELRDLDLKGAPYGYTPFCDSRKEMEGYRFWKTGYWQMHLGHRKYHISALYVVDLKKFRKIAAGDRLRGQYQGLSQDPNSLSNLDQDLPNNMIHQVNIFSLPQEWLYCDTWCSSDTLSKAKTIDLCNNPQTKEPKLQAAMRIVPEWKDYDNEVKNVMKKWQSEQSHAEPVIATPPSNSETHKAPPKEDL